MELLYILIAVVLTSVVLLGIFLIAIYVFSVAMSAFFIVLEWEHWIPVTLGLVVGIGGLAMFVFLISFVLTVVRFIMGILS